MSMCYFEKSKPMTKHHNAYDGFPSLTYDVVCLSVCLSVCLFLSLSLAHGIARGEFTSASPKPGQRRRATLIIVVVTQCRSTNRLTLRCSQGSTIYLGQSVSQSVSHSVTHSVTQSDSRIPE